MVIRMRNNIDAQQALRRMASEVAAMANTMVLAEGKRHDDVARWVDAVQAACAQRVAEHLTLGSEEPSGRAQRQLAEDGPCHCSRDRAGGACVSTMTPLLQAAAECL